MPRNAIFARFWRFHYFDWMMFMRRGSIYALGGCLVAVNVLFSSPDVSIKRAINRY